MTTNSKRKKLSLEERFWRHVEKGEGEACWRWTGAWSDNRGGQMYGCFVLEKGKLRGAHRVAWMLTNGEIPEGMFVCHHCDNTMCVRPDHLFLGTPSDNAKDMYAKGRQRIHKDNELPLDY